MKNKPIKGSDRKETSQENSREKRIGMKDRRQIWEIFANGYDK